MMNYKKLHLFLYLRAEINQTDTEALNGVMAFTVNG